MDSSDAHPDSHASADSNLELDPAPTAGQTVTVHARLPLVRSFDGWLRLPHPGVDAEGWYPVATLTVPAGE